MTSTLRFLPLVALPLLAAGCGGEVSALIPSGPDAGLAPDAPQTTVRSVVQEAPLNEAPLAKPVLEDFAVHPASLPLGGGPVLVSWAASEVDGCALLADDEPIQLGAEGEVLVSVQESTEFRVVCLDDEQDVVADASHLVDVLAPPAEDYAPDEELAVIAWETSELGGEFDEAGEVHEVAFSLAEDSVVTAVAAPAEARDGIELWLAADADGDGFVQPGEVIAYGWGSEVRLDEELPAGDYSVFVVGRAADTAWDLEVFVASTGPDGSNW